MTSTDASFDRELRSMRLLVEQTNNGLLAFALYDDIDVRMRIMDELVRTTSIKLLTVLLSPENNNPVEVLREVPETERYCLVFFNAEEAFPKFLGFVNLQREQLLGTRHALIFWVREEGMRRIANTAPDFWAWRSQVFDFRIPCALKEEERPSDPHDERIASFDSGLLRRQVSALEELEKPEAFEADAVGVDTSLGRRLLSLGRGQEAETVLRDALESARKRLNRPAQAEILTLLGNLYLERGSISEAESLYREALSLLDSSGKEAAPIYRQLSAVDLITNKLNSALEHALRSAQLSEAAGDLTSLAGALHQLGNVLSHEGKLREAEDAYLRATQLEQKLGMMRDLALTRYRLGRLYEKMGALQFAEGHLLDAIWSFEKEGMTGYEGRAWASLGRVYESRQDAERAKAAYDRAEQLQTSDIAT